ncbi:MAG: TauD/TfdA family dioxygenase [Rhizobiaceae bacterium]
MDNIVCFVDPAEWTGDNIVSGEGWKHILAPGEIGSLVNMAGRIEEKTGGDENGLLQLRTDDFDLGEFSPRLDMIYDGLKNGPGLALIRGLPVDRLTTFETAAIYWGIGRHLGEARPNNPQGDMLGHITDLGKTQSDPKSRGYQTREAMDYHCDQCDIVGLICIRTAKSGGVSKVASSVAMHNDLVREHPDMAQALSEPLCWTKHGEHSVEELPYYESPVFNALGGKLCTSFGPKHILKGHDLPGTPDLTDLHRQAIETAENIANRNRLEMELKPGDMQFLNNYVTLHTRSAFVDHDEPDRKRLLWRLWLMNPDLRERTGYTKQWEKGVVLGLGKPRIAV